MKKNKRYKLKKGRIFIALGIFISIIMLIFNIDNISNYIKLNALNYSKDSIKLITDNELEIEKYSKTLDNIINTKHFDKKYLEYYLEIIGMVITIISGVFVFSTTSQRSIHDYLAKTRVVGEDEKPVKKIKNKNKKKK